MSSTQAMSIYQAYHDELITLEERGQVERLNQLVARVAHQRWRAQQQQALEEVGPMIKQMLSYRLFLSARGKNVNRDALARSMGFCSFVHLCHHHWLCARGLRQ